MESVDFGKLIEDARREGVARYVVAALITSEAGVLLLRRPLGDFMGGLFELPSGKVEAGETLDHALRREVQEAACWWRS